ncbi:MAG: hypothetical protein KA436_11835 [Oligoflexales bacterium]|nr:hypothetical protein [Oligoflexales bacterium]
MTKALAQFEITKKRCDDLLNLADEEKLKSPSSESLISDALVRYGIVISVAAFDSYFTDVYVENFTTILKCKNSFHKDLKNYLSETFEVDFWINCIKSEKDKRPFRRIHTEIKRKHSVHVTQSFNAIDDLLKIYEIKELSKNVENAIKSPKEINKQIRKLIDRRNKIVHEADVTEKKGKLGDLDYKQIRKQINYLKMFVDKCDELLTVKIDKLKREKGKARQLKKTVKKRPQKEGKGVPVVVTPS